ncbi:MAG: agmatine deiminase family protein [Planctomycetaceae bacterium]
MTTLPTPAELGYRMPAEWEPHEATWLSWPHKEASWPGAFEPVPEIVAQIVGVLTESELVRINVADEDMADGVRQLLRRGGVNLEAVRFHFNPTNDAWVRDHGPIYVVRDLHGRRERALIDWEYNAWGNKYPPYDLDNAIPQRIAAEFGEPVFSPGIVMEGGALDVNGRGDLLTTTSCLLNPNRNPQLTQQQIEQHLRDNLGVTNILWLGDGIVGDDTDGHIDDLTRFVSDDTVVTVVDPDPQDANHAPLQDNLARLRTLQLADGRPLRIVELPMPAPVIFEDQRLPASYANFLIANRRVLVPIFGDPQDQPALDTLQRQFPERMVVGIDCRALVWGLGAIHCLTQQQPAASR